MNAEERRWYLYAVRRWGWSKAELQRRTESQIHQKVHLDEWEDECYTKYGNDENKISSEIGRPETGVLHRIVNHHQQDNRKSGLTPCPTQVVLSWYQLLRHTGPPTHQQRLQTI